MSREPSYYEIALTQRQVVIAFVILLACLVVAFFSGVWVGSGARLPRASAEMARTDGSRTDVSETGGEEAPPSGSEPAPPPGRVGTSSTPAGAESGAERSAAQDDEPESLRFFSEAQGDDEQAPSAGGAPESPPAATSRRSARRPLNAPDDPRTRSMADTPVRPLPEPPEPVDPRATQPPGEGGPVIQVFSSHDQSQAQEVLDRLLRAGLDAYLSPAEVNRVIYYRVRLGPFRDREQAEAVAKQLREDYKLETWIPR